MISIPEGKTPWISGPKEGKVYPGEESWISGPKEGNGYSRDSERDLIRLSDRLQNRFGYRTEVFGFTVLDTKRSPRKNKTDSVTGPIEQRPRKR